MELAIPENELSATNMYYLKNSMDTFLKAHKGVNEIYSIQVRPSII